MTERGEGPRAHRFFDAIFALVTASVVSATTIVLSSGNTGAFVVVLIGALIFGSLFGLPAYVLARKHRHDKMGTAALVGLFLVAMPTSCGALPYNASDQIPGWWTPAGLGLGGLSAGLTFWIMMKWPFAWALGSPWLRNGMNGLAAMAAIGATNLIPFYPADRSCHNPLRDGRPSLETIAQFELLVGVSDWRAVMAEIEDFGVSGHWSIRSDVRPDDDFKWFQISLCKEAGTVIYLQEIAGEMISFAVMQPQGGPDWQAEFGAVYRRVDARWPGKIRFRDERGNIVTLPPKWIDAAAASRPGNVSPPSRKE